MIRFGFALLVIGGVLVGFSVYEWSLAREATAQPEEIALKQLIARGPAGNPNIVLKDFDVWDEWVVVEHKGARGDNNAPWTKVWVPVVPADLGQQAPANLRQTKIAALLFSTRIAREEDLARLHVPRLRGLVMNRVQSLGSEEKRLLQQNYPASDFDQCLIIHEGRELTSVFTMSLAFGGGVVLILVGGGLMLFGFLGRQVDREWKAD